MPGKSGECDSPSDETNESNNTCRLMPQTFGLLPDGQLLLQDKVAKTEINRLQLIHQDPDDVSDKERVVQLQEENFASSLNQQLSKVIYYSQVNRNEVFELSLSLVWIFYENFMCVALSSEANLDGRVC